MKYISWGCRNCSVSPHPSSISSKWLELPDEKNVQCIHIHGVFDLDNVLHCHSYIYMFTLRDVVLSHRIGRWINPTAKGALWNGGWAVLFYFAIFLKHDCTSSTANCHYWCQCWRSLVQLMLPLASSNWWWKPKPRRAPGIARQPGAACASVHPVLLTPQSSLGPDTHYSRPLIIINSFWMIFVHHHLHEDPPMGDLTMGWAAVHWHLLWPLVPLPLLQECSLYLLKSSRICVF